MSFNGYYFLVGALAGALPAGLVVVVAGVCLAIVCLAIVSTRHPFLL